MKKKALPLLWLILFLGATCSLAQAGSIRVYFSPNGGCTDAILSEINQAKTEILLQAYSFTSTAHRPGVDSGPKARRQDQRGVGQVQPEPEIFRGHVFEEHGNPRVHRRQARHRSQ